MRNREGWVKKKDVEDFNTSMLYKSNRWQLIMRTEEWQYTHIILT